MAIPKVDSVICSCSKRRKDSKIVRSGEKCDCILLKNGKSDLIETKTAILRID